MQNNNKRCIIAFILAGGRGTRMGGHPLPKQYMTLQGKSVFQWSLDQFEQNPHIDLTLPIIHPDDMPLYDHKVKSQSSKRLPPCLGGIERADSVYEGIKAIDGFHPTHVLIHDAARPATPPSLIQRVVDRLNPTDGIIPSLPVVDTLRRQNTNGTFTDIDRADLYTIQTPQGFPYPLIKSAYELYFQGSPSFNATDDAGIYSWAGHSVTYIQGCEYNKKLTHSDDLIFLEKALS